MQCEPVYRCTRPSCGIELPASIAANELRAFGDTIEPSCPTCRAAMRNREHYLRRAGERAAARRAELAARRAEALGTDGARRFAADLRALTHPQAAQAFLARIEKEDA